MSRIKYLFTLIVALLLVVLFTACTDQKLASPTPIPPTATAVPPTNTPVPTNTPLPTATPLPTDTPTPTPEIPVEMSAELDEIEAQVSNMRGLTLPQDFQPDVYSQAELEQYFTTWMDDNYSEEEEFQDLVTLSYLGLMPPEFSLYDFLSQRFAEQTFGFYDIPSNQMVLVPGAQMDPLTRVAYAMQVVEAGLDASLDLDGAYSYNDATCDVVPDQCAAVQALIAGDQTLTSALWMMENMTPADQTEMVNLSDEASQNSVMTEAPLFFQEDNAFPYTVGVEFVSAIYQQGGWEAVNQVYNNPPLSTEHIMHPDRYPADVPLEVTLPDLLPVLGEGWELLDQNTLGEWSLLLVFTSGVDPAARQEITSAMSAVTGWGGDLYSTYFNPNTGQVVLVSKVTWDTPEDAQEYYDMLGVHVNTRFTSINTDAELLDMFNYLALGYANWYIDGSTTYYVLAPSEEVSTAVLNAVAGQ
jgi:hypothetical protein